MFKRRKQKQLDNALEATQGNSVESDVLLAALANDYLKDQKNKRRWRWAMFALIAIYLSFSASLFWGTNDGDVTGEHVAMIELDGTIGIDSGVEARSFNKSLTRAMRSKSSKGLILTINSPGGTPVQSAQINQHISRLREQYPNKPIYSVVFDLCASGAYYVAVATDKIFASPSSLIGSIGVRMDGFGFVDAMQKLGVERRTLTAGENKALLDPFLPVDEQQQQHTQSMLNDVHQEFIEAVQLGRGDRLKPNEDLFSGLIWSGKKAIELGLIDEFADIVTVAKDEFGLEQIVDYTNRDPLWQQFTNQFGVAVGKGLATIMQQRTQLY